MDKRLESFDVLNSVIFLMCSDKSHGSHKDRCLGIDA